MEDMILSLIEMTELVENFKTLPSTENSFGPSTRLSVNAHVTAIYSRFIQIQTVIGTLELYTLALTFQLGFS